MGAARELDYTRYYRWWHDESDAHFEQEVGAAEMWLSRFWPNERSAPILDIGCGMGFAVASFQRAGFVSVKGIDADRRQVSLARSRELPVSYVPSADTFNWMRERVGKYAFVTAVDVLEHIPRDQQLDFLEGVHNLLHPGGSFLCRVPNANSSLASIYRYGDWTHHTCFTQHSLDFVLYNAGFEDIRIEATRPQPLSRRLTRPSLWLLGCFRLFRRLEMIGEFGRVRGSRIPLTANIVAVAKKAGLSTSTQTRHQSQTPPEMTDALAGRGAATGAWA